MIDARSVWELATRRAARTPDALMAIDDRDRTLTFAQLVAQAERVAAGLHELGVRAGTTVAWQLPTQLETVVLLTALARLGAVQVPMLPIYREREVGFVVRESRAELLVVPGEWRGFDHAALAHEVARERQGLRVLVVDAGLPEADASVVGHGARPRGDPVRFLYYTSGTTGDPKGVRHSDGTLLAAGRAMGRAFAVRATDRAAIVFPIAHVGGLVWVATTLMSGCCALVVEAFDADASIAFLDAHDVTIAGGGTVFCQQYLAAARRDPSRRLFRRVRLFAAGAAPKPPDLHDALKREIGGIGLLSSYGMTECPITTCHHVDDPQDTMPTTEGRATEGVEIVAVADDGTRAAPGAPGELRVRGPQLFRGYVDASLDADAFDEDGRFRTGDLGSVDERGFVTVTGRVKDVIIRKGESISAKEVEDLLHAHPKVDQVAVIGLPDPELGERVCAVVTAVDPDDPLAYDEMVQHLSGQRLMRQKIPEQLEVVDDLPRNATGKVLKQQLRERCSRGPSPGRG